MESKYEMSRNAIIREYWELEDRLKVIAKTQSVSIEELTENLSSQSDDVINNAQTLLERQVELLYVMRKWELGQYQNVSLMPLTCFKNR